MTKPTLDRFETALLEELKTEVARNAAAVPAPPRRRRRVLGFSLGGVVAAGVTALGVSTLMPNPAFSVTEHNGELTVKVNRLEGAENLERELAEHGVTADITFLAPGMRCQGGRYVAAEDVRGTQISIGGEDFQVKLDSGAVRNDQTFVLWASVQQYENGNRSSVEFDVAEGAVVPCEPEADPDWSTPVDPDMGAPIPD
ncbi:hypothetical protein IEQ44_09020 [Nocardioides sp. Y6]|uniref:Uncharacterized protein n=1 Tax=Nocardioides malaquae TaxID=2773426 RepID=A0ABR9RTA3_9ACTN|nr:hypothetical protein [Nocardioides malaquae]MBE7324794.1 hypothetical protein [Nocardioides malaquae]